LHFVFILGIDQTYVGEISFGFSGKWDYL
jgi:hypothetical protein